MKAVLVMFDSLNRHYLSAYGCDWTHTPNFARLAERCAVFDSHFVGSLPCIPARRELHTGRYNFLHRSWGPLEPFDDSMPQLLRENGVYTHLATDHMHYFEDGGATYHQRYSSWDVSRGQEGDPWMPNVSNGTNIDFARVRRQDDYNRTFMPDEADYPMTRTFDKGLDFLARNHDADRWLLTVETFDPHEPYYVPERYKALYRHLHDAGWPDWPTGDMSVDAIEQTRYAYAALISMCDANLGRLLDAMDAYNLWEDTMLILNTDHGFLHGEHGGLGKVPHPYYKEVCNTPLMIWDPRCKAVGRRRALTQTIDIAPTLLEYFGLPIPPDMLGKPLAGAIAADAPVREAALFGVHGLTLNVTDGRYIHTRIPRGDLEAQPFSNYTLMPTHMRRFFSLRELQGATFVPPFRFTKGISVLRIPSYEEWRFELPAGDLLFDTLSDPTQASQANDPQALARLQAQMTALLRENDAPGELYARYALQE